LYNATPEGASVPTGSPVAITLDRTLTFTDRTVKPADRTLTFIE
jgi:hypothetical protein